MPGTKETGEQSTKAVSWKNVCIKLETCVKDGLRFMNKNRAKAFAAARPDKHKLSSPITTYQNKISQGLELKLLGRPDLNRQALKIR